MNNSGFNLFKETKIKFIDGDRGDNYPSKRDLTKQGFCIFLDTSNVLENGFNLLEPTFISEEKDRVLGQGKLMKNDIVLTTRGTIGHTGFYGEDVPFNHIRINSGMLIIRCDEKEYRPYYLYLFLRSKNFKQQCKRICSGSAQPQLPVSALKYAVLPKEEPYIQEEIISCIKSLDEKIMLIDKTITELEELIKLTYDYWFVQFDFPDEKGNPYKFSGGEMFDTKECQYRIPKGWEIAKLGDIIPTSLGGTPSSDNKINWANGTISWLSSGEIEKLHRKQLYPQEYVCFQDQFFHQKTQVPQDKIQKEPVLLKQ